jgi:serine/threonine protein kinase
VIAGRYSLDREIGRGGTGVVWLGRDEVLGRPVALKRIGLLPGADRTDLARAEREAQLSARLNHRHVVSVFDVVVDAESTSSSSAVGRCRRTTRRRCSGRPPTRWSPLTPRASPTAT